MIVYKGINIIQIVKMKKKGTTMKNKRKLITNIILFVLLIILTFMIVFKDDDITDIFNIIASVKIQYLLIGILCMALYICFEAINIGRTLKVLKEKSSFLKNVKYALIGFFFSSVTPAASGGQPMQIYYMYKDNINVSSSTITLLLNLASMQIITIGVALISLIFNYQYLNHALVLCFIVGILLNLSALILLVIAIFSKRLSKGLINIAIKLLGFLKVKNLEEKKIKYENELSKYHNQAIFIRNNRKLIVKTILTTLIQFLIFYSITYWVYRSFGFSENGIIKIISMQSVLYATVSGIPSPGAVGVSEGAFIEIFKNVYSSSMMSSAVLLNRGINFYLFVIIGGIVTIINQIKSRFKGGIR